MIGVHGEPISATRIRVRTVHWKPEKLSEESKAKFTFVDSIPEEPGYVKGKKNVLFINPQTKELWYEQQDRPLNQAEVMADQSAELAEIKGKLDQLIQLQTEANNLAKGV